jgi:Putative bacterial sensory transduction regulator
VSDAFDSLDLDVIEQRISAWFAAELDRNPAMAAVDRGDAGERRWYVRLRGEEKDITTIWLTLGQRTLRYETYVMPAPEENHETLYAHLLRRNYKLVGAGFAIGPEDAVYLVGQLPLKAFDETELDRVVGSVLAYVEQCFRPALQIGFESRFASLPVQPSDPAV